MSDQDETIFNKDPEQTTPQDSSPTTDDNRGDNRQPESGFENLLSEITAPDGRQKYSSVEDALKSLQHSQSHIQTLEDEMKELRNQLEETRTKASEYETKSKTMEELISEFKAGKQTEEEKPSTVQEVDPEFIEQTVYNALTRRQQEEAASKNVNTVIEAFKEKYGEEKAEEVFYGKAEEIGVGREFINSLAMKSPKAIFELYGIDHKPKRTDPVGDSSVNTDRLDPNKPKPSAKVGLGASTKDMVAAWKAAGEALDNN